MIPGNPLAVQNYVLGAANIPFDKYVLVSLPIQYIQIAAYVYFGEGVFEGGLSKLMLGTSILLVIAVIARMLDKRYGYKLRGAKRMEFLKQSDEVLSVGEFSRRFKMLVKTCVPELWLRGEISNLKTYSSGHTYFTLKDEEGSISAVLFKGYSRAVSFQLREGMKVFLYGEIAVYEVRGCYQMVVKAALPDGTGDLARRFEELKKGFRRKAFSTRSAKNLSRAFREKLLW